MILGRRNLSEEGSSPPHLPLLPKTFGWWGGGAREFVPAEDGDFSVLWKGCMPWRENGHGHVQKKNASVSV